MEGGGDAAVPTVLEPTGTAGAAVGAASTWNTGACAGLGGTGAARESVSTSPPDAAGTVPAVIATPGSRGGATRVWESAGAAVGVGAAGVACGVPAVGGAGVGTTGWTGAIGAAAGGEDGEAGVEDGGGADAPT